MKIAWCLHGQPRHYENGYKNIMNYIKEQKVECDFFFHAWYNNNDYINQASWAELRNGKIKINKDLLNDVIDLYKPKDYIIEEQKNFEIDNDSFIYKQTNNKQNISNVLSVLYSTESSINVMSEYVKFNNLDNYDFIFISRFDFLKPIKLNLNNINKNYIYSSDIHLPRNLISPALLCGGYNKIYNLINNLYSNITYFKNINKLNDILNNYCKVNMIINHEEMVMTNLYYNNLSINDIKFTSDIPNFI